MAQCKRCGREIWAGGSICHPCLRKWGERRKVALAQAVKEIGPITAETLKAIQKRVKELVKKSEEDSDGK